MGKGSKANRQFRMFRQRVGRMGPKEQMAVVDDRLHDPRIVCEILKQNGIDPIAILRGLSYREREIIKLRYGLGDGYSYTLKEVGHIFKVTHERIRTIERRAIQKLALYASYASKTQEEVLEKENIHE